jgi:hypothetical protein
MFEKTAQAVHRPRKQRKLFNIQEGSASCPSFETTAQAVHRNEYQQRQKQLGLFAVRDINTS